MPLRRLLIAGATAFLLSRIACAQLPLEEMNGIWEGAVSVVGGTPDSNRGGFRVGDSIRLRLQISSDHVSVLVLDSDSANLRNIYIGRLASNAIILGVMRTTEHIESWALTATLQDERTMLVALSRGVRPLRDSGSAADVFTIGSLGELRQIE